MSTCTDHSASSPLYLDAHLSQSYPAKRRSYPARNGINHRRAVVISDAFEVFCKGPSLVPTETFEDDDRSAIQDEMMGMGRGRSGSMEYFRFSNDEWSVDMRTDMFLDSLSSTEATMDSDRASERSTSSKFILDMGLAEVGR